MRFTALVVSCLAILGLGCESMPGRPLPSERPVRPKDVTSFDVLWSTNCAGCHGADGTLGAARSLNDPLYLAWASDMNLRLIIRQGAAGTLMPAFSDGHGGSLTDAQIDILVKEMRHRWAKAAEFRGVALPPYAAGLGDASRGARVYADLCARCHGADGTGGTAHGSIVDPAYLALVSNQALRSSIVAGREDLGMPGYLNLRPGCEDERAGHRRRRRVARESSGGVPRPAVRAKGEGRWLTATIRNRRRRRKCGRWDAAAS